MMPEHIIAYAQIVKPVGADLANENPGATAIATGVKDVVVSVCLAANYIAAFPILAMHWGAPV